MRLIERIMLATILAIAVGACEQDHVFTPQEIDARPLTQIDAFESGDQMVVRAAIEHLSAGGVNSDDFYLTPIKRRSDGLLELELWHKAAFAEPLDVGNPGGQSRTLVYEARTNAIVEEWAWQ
ncbi:MAG: hypothetical protein ABL989_13330 [Gammaproteobacteria bacterium]